MRSIIFYYSSFVFLFKISRKMKWIIFQLNVPQPLTIRPHLRFQTKIVQTSAHFYEKIICIIQIYYYWSQGSSSCPLYISPLKIDGGVAGVRDSFLNLSARSSMPSSISFSSGPSASAIKTIFHKKNNLSLSLIVKPWLLRELLKETPIRGSMRTKYISTHVY